MNKEIPISSGEFITLCALLLLALPIAYIASSGPVLAAASKKQMIQVNGAPYNNNYHLPRFSGQFSWIAEFYSPLFQTATTVRLEPELRAYLRWSGAIAVPVCSYQVMILPPRHATPASKR